MSALQTQFPRPQRDTVRVSLATARARAVSANPDLAAARLDTTVARGQLRQAAVIRFNPSADFVARPNGSDIEAGVSQEIEIFGQRGARLSAGRAGFQRAQASVRDATRVLIGEVDRAFYRLASASQRAKLSNEVVELNTRLADVAARQMREGEISRLDFNLATVELGRARARLLATRREQDAAAISLGRLMGLPNGTGVAAIPDSIPSIATDASHGVPGTADSDTAHANVDLLIAHALRLRPDLAERSAAVKQAEAQVSVSRREALPNPVVRGVVEQPATGSSRTFRPGLGLTLPFLNRNQGEVQALRASARQAALQRAAVERSIRAEIGSAVATYESATSEVRILATTVLGPARQNRNLVEIAYREGKVGLAELLLIQNQAIDAELDYWNAWLAAREALADLTQATAQNIEELEEPNLGTNR